MDKVSINRFLSVASILCAVIGFISLVGKSMLPAMIVLIFGIIGSVPYFALATAIEDIDELKKDIGTLKYHIQKLTAADTGNNSGADRQDTKMPSLYTWKCKKCGTINKPGAMICINCSAKDI